MARRSSRSEGRRIGRHGLGFYNRKSNQDTCARTNCICIHTRSAYLEFAMSIVYLNTQRLPTKPTALNSISSEKQHLDAIRSSTYMRTALRTAFACICRIFCEGTYHAPTTFCPGGSSVAAENLGGLSCHTLLYEKCLQLGVPE
jgi:hypothetical protein